MLVLFLQPTLPPTSLVACTLIVLKRFASCCVHAYIFFSWLLSNMDFFSMPPSVYYIRLSLWSRLNMCAERRCASHVLHPPSSRNPKISPPPPPPPPLLLLCKLLNLTRLVYSRALHRCNYLYLEQNAIRSVMLILPSLLISDINIICPISSLENRSPKLPITDRSSVVSTRPVPFFVKSIVHARTPLGLRTAVSKH